MWRTFRSFASFYLVYPWATAGFVLSVLFLGLVESVQSYFYKLFVDVIPTGDYQILVWLLIVFMGVKMSQTVFDILAYFMGDVVLFKAARDARIEVVRHIQDLDFAYHAQKSTGSLISVVRRGDGSFFNLHHALIRIVRVVIIFIAGLVIFSFIEPTISYILAGSFLTNLVLTKFLISNNIKKRKWFNKAEDEISRIVVDNLINFETVKLFAKERQEIVKLRRSFVTWTKRFWKYANSFRAFDVGIGLPSHLFLLLMLWLGATKTIQGQLGAGDFVLIVGFVTSFYGRLFDLLYSFRDIAKNYTDLASYLKILEEKVQVKDPRKVKRMVLVKGEIRFEKVKFSYPGGKADALNEFDLKIRQGESVALVGRSGSGKTTAVKLLMRFYDVDKGRITIDGVDVKQMKKAQLRSFIGVVPQEPILFNQTIGYNIGYGGEGSSQKEVEAAAKMAYLDEFIKTLPKKYKTDVGERGIKLSGGQKQRLAIARMIISNPRIIIFDEATSNLDSESERMIQKSFWKFAQNRTTLVIAHRLSTVMRADKIVVLDQGRVVEQGTHGELLQRRGGLYRHFWYLQQEGDLEN